MGAEFRIGRHCPRFDAQHSRYLQARACPNIKTSTSRNATIDRRMDYAHIRSLSLPEFPRKNACCVEPSGFSPFILAKAETQPYYLRRQHGLRDKGHS